MHVLFFGFRSRAVDDDAQLSSPRDRTSKLSFATLHLNSRKPLGLSEMGEWSSVNRSVPCKVPKVDKTTKVISAIGNYIKLPAKFFYFRRTLCCLMVGSCRESVCRAAIQACGWFVFLRLSPCRLASWETFPAEIVEAYFTTYDSLLSKLMDCEAVIKNLFILRTRQLASS